MYYTKRYIRASQLLNFKMNFHLNMSLQSTAFTPAHLPNAGNNHWGQVKFQYISRASEFCIWCEESIRMRASYPKNEFRGLFWMSYSTICQHWFGWWYCWARSHWLNQCQSKSPMSYGITRLQWVKSGRLNIIHHTCPSTGFNTDQFWYF